MRHRVRDDRASHREYYGGYVCGRANSAFRRKRGGDRRVLSAVRRAGAGADVPEDFLGALGRCVAIGLRNYRARKSASNRFSRARGTLALATTLITRLLVSMNNVIAERWRKSECVEPAVTPAMGLVQ